MASHAQKPSLATARGESVGYRREIEGVSCRLPLGDAKTDITQPLEPSTPEYFARLLTASFCSAQTLPYCMAIGGWFLRSLVSGRVFLLKAQFTCG